MYKVDKFLLLVPVVEAVNYIFGDLRWFHTFWSLCSEKYGC